MKVLLVEPDKIPREAEIEGDLHSMQALVGGSIEAVYPYEDLVAVVCNEEGKINGMPLNRALHDEDGQVYDILAGNFFIAGLDESSFTDLPPELMEKYKEQFLHPEEFYRFAGKVVAVKQPVPDEHDKQPTKSGPEL